MKKKDSALRRIVLLALVSTVFLTALVGCTPSTPSGNAPPSTPPADAAQVPVKLYFVNNDYIATGDESLPKFMLVEGTIPADQAGDGAVLLELLRAPTGENTSTALEPAVKILGVAAAKDDATVLEVNLAQSGLNGSSLTEQMLIGQIVGTLLDNPPKQPATAPKAVRFLVEGKPVESLMGHIDTSVPIDLTDPIFPNRPEKS